MCARCEELQEEVAYLRSELGLRARATDLQALRETFGLTGNEARVALILARANGRTVMRAQIEEAMPARSGVDDRCSNLVSVVVNNVRRKIGKEHIPTAWAAGYAMTAAGRALVLGALAESVAA